MYDHILIGVDGSDEAERAARRGLELASRVDASVTVLHVIEEGALGLTRTAGEETKLRQQRAELLAEVEETAESVGYPVETDLVGGGSAADRLITYATEEDADLLVLGRQGRSGISERLLGGVTERVLNQGTVPVLVVPDEADPRATFSRVLVPTDGSESAEAALPHAGALAGADDAGIDVLNVVDLQGSGGAFDAGGLKDEFVERLESEGEAAVEDAVTDLAEYRSETDIRAAVRRSAQDGAASGIRDHVAEHSVDLIVMGSRGHSNVKRKLLGSVTATVLRSVDVPVLAVPNQ